MTVLPLQGLDISPIGIVCPSKLGARLEVLGSRIKFYIVTLIIVVHVSAGVSVEESRRGAFGLDDNSRKKKTLLYTQAAWKPVVLLGAYLRFK
jgi:hypothetical protein